MLLITGITGLTGKFLYEEIQKSDMNKKVKYLVRKTSDISWLNEDDNVVFGDIRSVESMKSVFEDVTEVLHLAPRNQLSNILEICEYHNITRIYYVNSTGIYSDFKKSSHVDLRNEQLLKESDLIYTIIRPTMIYGNKQDGNIHLLVKIMNKTPIYPVIGSGNGLMHPIYAGDLAKAVFSAINKEELTRYKEYNLAGREPIKYSQLLKEISIAMNKKVFLLKTPYFLALLAGKIGNKIPNKIINYEKILRLKEDKNFDYSLASMDLNFEPLSFKEGISLEIKALQEDGTI